MQPDDTMGETTPVRDALELIDRRTSTRKFDEPAGVTDAQRAAVLHAASRAPSAGAMMMYSIIDIREQATLDRLAVLCDDQPMIAHAPWALVFVVDYCKWIDLFEHVGCFEDAFCERHGCAPKRHPGLGDLAIASQDAVIAAQNAVIAASARRLWMPRWRRWMRCSARMRARRASAWWTSTRGSTRARSWRRCPARWSCGSRTGSVRTGSRRARRIRVTGGPPPVRRPRVSGPRRVADPPWPPAGRQRPFGRGDGPG